MENPCVFSLVFLHLPTRYGYAERLTDTMNMLHSKYSSLTSLVIETLCVMWNNARGRAFGLRTMTWSGNTCQPHVLLTTCIHTILWEPSLFDCPINHGLKRRSRGGTVVERDPDNQTRCSVSIGKQKYGATSTSIKAIVLLDDYNEDTRGIWNAYRSTLNTVAGLPVVPLPIHIE